MIRFNGAVTRRPRKFGMSGKVIKSPIGFNGAVTRRPRKYGALKEYNAALDASMGP